MDEFSALGDWWLPEEPDRKVSGEVECSPSDGVRIDLSDALTGDEHHSADQLFSDSIQTIRYLYGKLKEGRKVTAISGIVSEYSVHGWDSVDQSCEFEKLLVGEHIDRESGFEKIKVQIPNLSVWMNSNLIKHNLKKTHERKENSSDQNLASYEIKKGCSHIAEMDGKEIKIISSVSINEKYPRELKITEKGYVSIHSDEKDLYKILNEALDVVKFLSLGMGGMVLPNHISVSQSSDSDRLLEVYTQLPNYSLFEEQKRSDYLFNVDQIDFETALTKWFNHREAAPVFHQQRDEVIQNPDLTPRLEFLTLVIAIESYHDHIRPDRNLMDEEKFDELKTKVFGSIPDAAGAEDRIKGLVRNIGNDPSLKDKIVTVVSEHEIFDEIIDTHEFASTVRDFRHNLAHGLDTVDNSELIEINGKLRILVDGILLSEVDIDTEDARRALWNRYGTREIELSPVESSKNLKE